MAKTYSVTYDMCNHNKCSVKIIVYVSKVASFHRSTVYIGPACTFVVARSDTSVGGRPLVVGTSNQLEVAGSLPSGLQIGLDGEFAALEVSEKGLIDF
jgi:hypothetical protein